MSVSSIGTSPQTLQQAAQTLSQSPSGQEQVKKGGHHHGGHRPNQAEATSATSLINGTAGTTTTIATTNTVGTIDTTA